MSQGEDLTGRQFGALRVLRKSGNFYIYPKSGKRRTKWVCLCEECGKEFETTRAILINAKNCGCRKPRPKNKKICVVCGKEFECSPSDKTVTCSPECRSARAASALKSRIEKGEMTTWTSDIRPIQKPSRETIARTQKLATEAAKQSHLSGRFKTNLHAKNWVLVDPSGVEHEVQNLALWAREHVDWFGKPPGDKSARQICTGFQAVSQTLKGKRGPGCKHRGACSYFGWTLKSSPTEPVGNNTNNQEE